MTKIVSQVASLIPRTAATDALLLTEQLVQKMANREKGKLAFISPYDHFSHFDNLSVNFDPISLEMK